MSAEKYKLLLKSETELCIILNTVVYTVLFLFLRGILMNISFEVKYLEYAKRSGNLDVEASGVVKSKKFFPYYMRKDRKVEIFKPLSKTKPCLTPLFAYAEVFWSNIINTYFMPAPCYELAICKGYAEKEPKYYDYGTLVPSICEGGERLVNLLEFFRENPDKHVDIQNYINYCMLFYDFTNIFESEFIQKNAKLGEELAMQVLISILKGDQNYHYENVAFICNEKKEVLRLAPMIDHEFSTMFLFPDDIKRNLFFFAELLGSIEGRKEEEDIKITNETERQLVIQSSQNLNKNICYISSHYPNVAASFMKKVEIFEKELDEIRLCDEGYLFPCNSEEYRIGRARYKEKDEEKARGLEESMTYEEVDLTLVEANMKSQIRQVIKRLREQIEKTL